jgi:hypothetical protein
LDHKLLLRPVDPKRAALFNLKSKAGPNFSLALSIDCNERMNTPNGGTCNTNAFHVLENYKVPTDPEGNSLLTGDGAGKNDA